MADEAKTPGTEGFADKIYRDLTGRDISEHGQFEMPPPDGAGEDPWDAVDLTPTPQPPLFPPRAFYDGIPIKVTPGLDTYEGLATHLDAVEKDANHLWMQRGRREVEREELKKTIDIYRERVELTKGTESGDILERDLKNFEESLYKPPEAGLYSSNFEISIEGLTPDPDVVAKYRRDPDYDTYEKLEAAYKQTLWERDREYMKDYESWQKDVFEYAVEDAGEAAADFVKDHPALGDVLQGANAAGDGETPFPINFFEDMPGVGDHVKDAKDAYQKEQNRVGADAGDGEIEMPPESTRDGGPLNYLRDLSGPTEEDELEKEAPPVDKPEPDASSATERVEPPGSEAAPIVEGEASTLIGGGASPTGDPRDEAFSGEEEEGEGAPAAAAAAAAAPAAAAAADAAVGGARRT